MSSGKAGYKVEHDESKIRTNKTALGYKERH